MNILPFNKESQPDEAEFNAFFPPPFPLKQFTKPTSGLRAPTTRDTIVARSVSW